MAVSMLKNRFQTNANTVANNFQNLGLFFVIFGNKSIVLNLSTLLFLHMKVYECPTNVWFDSDVLKTLSSIKKKVGTYDEIYCSGKESA